MAAPLRSANPGEQKSMQFAHFGLLDVGGQSKASTVTSLTLNVVIAFVVIIISAATAKQRIDTNRKLTELVMPITEQKPVPPQPKVIPPKLKPLPEIAKVEPPKITVPQVKAPELPKQPVVKMDTPKPVIAPPAPKQIIAKAAPVAVSLAHPEAASVVNNDPHPSAVRLGNSTSPLNNLHGPAVAPVNLAAGMPGMNAANTGNGPAATRVNLGNGSPGSTTTRGNGVVAVAGIPHGIPGATGTSRAAGAQQVSLGQSVPPPSSRPAAVSTVAMGKEPKVIYKPKPEYTAEAIQKHVEGVVSLHIRVMPNGSVQVLSIAKPLGYGLDDSARRVAMAMKFEPATDASGAPIVWEGVVNVSFQLAG
jgi:protein TonB